MTKMSSFSRKIIFIDSLIIKGNKFKIIFRSCTHNYFCSMMVNVTVNLDLEDVPATNVKEISGVIRTLTVNVRLSI